MTVTLRPTTPDGFSVPVTRPVLYDIASELRETPTLNTIVIDLSSESSESAKRHDTKLAARVAQVIGMIIAALGVVICLYAYMEKKIGFTGLGLIISSVGCVISSGATCFYFGLTERERVDNY